MEAFSRVICRRRRDPLLRMLRSSSPIPSPLPTLISSLLSTATAPSSSAADHFLRLLQSPPSLPTLELTLSRSHPLPDLTPSALSSVLRRSPDCLLALRFFVWAGLLPGRRHSAASYDAASSALDLPRHPRSLTLLLDSYLADAAPVSLKTFRILLNLSLHAALPDEAVAVLRRMPDFGCRPDTASYNTVIRLLADAGRGEAGAALLDEMALAGVCPDMVSFVSAVRGLCVSGKIDAAQELIPRMRTVGCVPNVVVYSAMIDGMCCSGNLDAAVELLGEMESNVDAGCVPNVVTYTCLIKCLCENGHLEAALAVLDRMGRRGVLPNRVFVHTLLGGFCAQGRADEAYELIERFIGEGSISGEECYSLLVLCLLRIGKLKDAEGLISRMLDNGVRPDGSSCNSMMRELLKQNRFLDGYMWLGMMEDLPSITIDSDVRTHLLIGLCEAGCLHEASLLARKIIEKGKLMDASCVDYVAEALRRFGEGELASRIVTLKEQQEQ